MSSPAQSITQAPPLVRPWSPALAWKRIADALGSARCRLLHREISRPVHGHYRCWVCLR
jgi:hypothetical protein